MEKNITFSKWKGNDYITIVKKDCIEIYKNDERHAVATFNLDTDRINGAVFAEEILYFTYTSENVIYMTTIEQTNIEKITLDRYMEVRIINYLRGSDGLYAIRVKTSCKSKNWYEYKSLLYNMKNKKEMFEIPMSRDGFKDIAMYDKDTLVQLPSYIHDFKDQDEDDKMEFRIIKYSMEVVDEKYQHDEKIEYTDLEDYTSIYSMESWDTGNYVSSEVRKKNLSLGLRFTLFDYFLYNWPKNLSISADGKYHLEWSEDIKGLMIGSLENGDVKFYFEAPDGATEESKYFFDEEKSWLYIITETDIRLYEISQDKVLLQQVNRRYNEYYKMKKSLACDFDYRKLFYKCLYSARLVSIY